MRALRTVADRLLRGPFAPSEAAVAVVVWLVGIIVGGAAGTFAGWTGVSAAFGGAATTVAALAVRDQRARLDRRDGRRRR